MCGNFKAPKNCSCNPKKLAPLIGELPGDKNMGNLKSVSFIPTVRGKNVLFPSASERIYPIREATPVGLKSTVNGITLVRSGFKTFTGIIKFKNI